MPPVSQEEKNTAAQSAVAVYKRSLLVSNEKKQCKDQVETRHFRPASTGHVLGVAMNTAPMAALSLPDLIAPFW